MFDRKVNNRRAQSTLEYAVIISVIVAALLTMQVYIKRGIQGKLRSAADEIGRQYDPGNTISDMTFSLSGDITTKIESGVEGEDLTTTTTVTINNETETRDGWEEVGALGDEL